MEFHVAWAGTGICAGVSIGREFRVGRVELVDYDLVEAEIGDEHETIVRRNAGPVRMR